jgi:trehalose 6-phosphate synthase
VTEIVLISDRGPFTFVHDGPQLRPIPRHSSVTSLLYAAAHHIREPLVWISASHSRADSEALTAGDFDYLSSRLGYRTIPVVFSETEFANYYREVGARQLWAALLDLWDEVPSLRKVKSSSFDSYQRVNREIGRIASEKCSADSLILINDYQLAMVGRYIRTFRPEQWTALFLHTPFATLPSLARLPTKVRESIMDGMLSTNLVGFQRREWLDRFMDCCQALGLETDLPGGAVLHERGRTWIRCYPTPIDVKRLALLRKSDKIIRRGRMLRPPSVQQLIVRVDRVDPTKNIVRGFQAFRLLLREHSQMHRRVHFLACLVPTRQNVAEYRCYLHQIRLSVAETLAEFPGSISICWGEDRDTAMAALSVYDVLLVNPLSDGMNLVAQEGPAINDNNGAVILSASAGAADLLREKAILLMDPWSLEETKESLLRALEMSRRERKERAENMRRLVTSRDPLKWLSEQISDLQLIRTGQIPSNGAY